MVNLLGRGFIGSHYASQYQCDVNSRNDLVPKHPTILYLISTTDNYNLKTNPFIDIDTNLTTLIRVLENSRNLKNVVFNFASSWFVYGKSTIEVDEDSPCNPRGFYSITKRAAEQLLISYCETYDINYRIMRFANVLGPGDKVSPKKNALTYVISRLIDNQPIQLFDGGNFYRDYIHVEDLCRAINLVMLKGDLNTVYNIGTGHPSSFKSAVEYAMYRTESCSEVTHIDTGNTESFTMRCEKLQRLGFIPKYNLHETIDDVITYLRSR